jgi:hypothetical protein
MGATCSTHGKDKECLLRKAKGKRPFKRLSVQGGTIKMDLRRNGSEDMNWFLLIQDRVYWWALVTTVMNLRVP